MSYGAETLVFFEIDQPLCVHSYGNSPCQAELGTTGPRKCFNTRFTCQDAENYLATTGSPAETNVLTLRFGRSQLDALQYGYVIPALVQVTTAPGMINLGGMDRNAAALGTREVATVKLEDFRHSDLVVDPYRLERISGDAVAETGGGYDPEALGTFWGKWLARNPYHQHYRCRIREGYIGDALEAMRVRHYVIDRIDGPTDGMVSVVAKDLFSLIEARKAVAPPASRGELSANLAAAGGSFSVSPTGIGDLDYPIDADSPNQVVVAIGDEEILCTRSGDTFTVVERGHRGTVAEDHDEEDLVQWVLVYETERAHDIVYDVLTEYGGIAASAINTAVWDANAVELVQLYSAHITKPTPVQELVGELAEQAGFTCWPDVGTGEINFVPLRAQAPTAVVTDAAWIVADSLALKRQVSKRVSQVLVYYGQINAVEDLDERRNYHSRVVTVDPTAETEEQYGTPAIREVFSRWIPQFGRQAAEDIGERILALFRDPPLEAAFSLHASRAGELELARYFTLNTAEVQDDTGSPADTTMAAIEIERGENELSIRAQQVAFFTADDDTGERVIYIENNILDANLRSIHDALYSVPTPQSPALVVRFVILEGIVVGASSTGGFALDTGDWTGTGVELILEMHGRVAGRGGRGGQGGGGSSGLAGKVGLPGGPAMKLRYDIEILGDGVIAGGAGGGGGGGVTQTTFFGGVVLTAPGGGGGGGAGSVPGEGGLEGAPEGDSTAGATATVTAGGAGGNGAGAAGDGGTGGAPGTAGSSGQAGSHSAGGAGGAAGAAIEGVAFATFTGTVTVIGSTS